MSILKKLASSQNLKGNDANIQLAIEIANNNDITGVKELVANLSNKNKNIQSDCIKTLYEIGYIKPDLIAQYCDVFLNLLSSKNNRLIWGAMIALATVANIKHQEIFKNLELIAKTINNGSVITIDNGIEIFAKLCVFSQYSPQTEPLLIDQLWKCPIKQLPQYIEKSIICINNNNFEIFTSIIEKRKKECETESQLKRLEKALKQIFKKSS